MSWEVAKAGVDTVLRQSGAEGFKGIVVDFIGGEPLLQTDLIGQIIDYTHQRLNVLQHRYLKSHVFSINTNGVLYETPNVQKLVNTHKCLHTSITIDGDQVMHDLNRVYGNGSGTYNDVKRNVRLWMQRTPARELSTKVTINHNNLLHFPRGIAALFELGLQSVNANVVFENDWQAGDEHVFEAQLMLLGREMQGRGIPLDKCSLFAPHIGKPCHPGDRQQNWCGVGRYMLAIDPVGDIYPCNHFVPSGLKRRRADPIGTVFTGVDQAKLAPYLRMNRETKSPPECLTCDVATGCAWCAGFDFDEFGTLDKRATYICKMHKARVKAIRALEQEDRKRCTTCASAMETNAPRRLGRADPSALRAVAQVLLETAAQLERG